jgi:TonB-linked SusC/RagA family outer membrane protein
MEENRESSANVHLSFNSIMKRPVSVKQFSFLLFFIALLGLATSVSAAQRISIWVDDTEVEQILSTITGQTGLSIAYSKQVVNLDRKVSIHLSDVDVSKVMDCIVDGTSLSYEVKDGKIYLFEKSRTNTVSAPAVRQQNTRTLTGVVVDTNGDPVIGANVLERGTSNGATTDVDGKFSLSIRTGAVLVVSYVGYLQQTVSVGNQASLRIELREDTKALDEVVVIGYGAVKKSDLTGSVASVSSRAFKDQPITRVEDALQGRMAGVDVQTISGAPGSDIKIRVRGSSSINKSNDPLYVVDGIVTTTGLTGINPADIASIEVLKDASSTAIYGSRGANGVVLISTTRGSSDRRSITFDTELGWSTIPKKYDLLNAYEYGQALNDILGREVISSADMSAYQNGTKGIDWQDLILQTGMSQNYKLTLSGGNRDTQYLISGNVLDQTGITITTKFNRYIARTNITSRLTDWLSVTTDMRLSHMTSHNNNLHEGGKSNVIGVAINYSPTMELINPSTGYYAKDPYNSLRENPYALLQNDNDFLSNSANGMVDFRFNIAKGLTFSVIAGINYNDRKTYTLNKKAVSGSTNDMSNEDQYRLAWQNTNNLTYTNTWGDHSLTATGVFELASDQYRQMRIAGTNLLTEGVGYWNVGMATSRSEANNYSESSLASWVGRAIYSFKNRYILTGTFRADGSSRFTNKKWGYFPSGAIAWNVAEEGFMKDLDLFQQLKVRASYGVIGNQAINSYDVLGLLSSTLYSYGGSSQYTGYWGNAVATPDLSWEKTYQTDIGVDFSLLNQRLNVTLDWYLKQTKDALLQRSIPGYDGGGTYWVNRGQIKNTGFEAAVSAFIFQNPNGINWNSSLNMSYMKNEVVDLAGDPYMLGSIIASGLVQEATIIKPGYPIGSLYGLTFLGYDEQGRNIYEDKDNNGMIDSGDYDIIGKAIPDLNFGWNNVLSWKNWEFNIFFNAAFGGEKFNLTRWCTAVNVGDSRFITLRDAYFNGFDKVGAGAEFGTQKNMTGNLIQGNTTQWIESSDFIKLKNLSIAYTFPKALTHFADVRLAFSCQNLLTITGYKGLDPEASSITGNADINAGMDLGAYPTPRTFTLGARLTF